MKKKKEIISGILFLALVAAIVLYATGTYSGDRVGAGREPLPEGLPPPAGSDVAKLRTIPAWEDAVGTVTSRTRVEVAAQVQARVKAVHVDAGQAVEETKPLVDLADEELVARRDQAKDGLRQAQAARERAVQAKARSEAVAEHAKKRYDRIQRLRADSAATEEEMEAAEAGLLQARASVAEAGAAIAAADAQIQQAKQVVAQAEVALGHATISVPLTGVVSLKAVEEGDLAWPGKTLFEILDPTDLRLEAQVREGLIEELMAAVRAGEDLEIRIPALDLTVAGTVSEVCPTADPASRTFRVRVEFEPDEGVQVRPGMFGRLRIPLGEREVVTVPVAAVGRTGQLQSVHVEIDGRWERRMVTTGKYLDDGSIEILSGLAGGEKVGLPEGAR
jgi:RND family efflux transporter MFP subunit